MLGMQDKTIYLDVGDINFDGKIDNEDYMLLAQYTATGPNADKLPYNKANWTPTDKQLAVMNCRRDNEWHIQNINIDDAIYLYNYINNIGGIIDLGVTPYTVKANVSYEVTKNVSNLLIIEGHYDDTVNIPFLEFTKNDWAIHDKFFNYLFGMAIHKYSNTENISYLQKLLKEAYPMYYDDTATFQVGIYTDNMKNIMKDYQVKQLNYTVGDLNNDNKLTVADLTLLRNYLDDSADYTTVYKYLLDPILYPLTEDEIKRLDQDGDNFLTTNDLNILNNKLSQKYSATLRSRADIDGNGLVEEFDYTLLSEIIDKGYAVYIDKYGNEIYKDLKNYTIPFQLGWMDVQTERILEYDVNGLGNISEVSK